MIKSEILETVKLSSEDLKNLYNRQKMLFEEKERELKKEKENKLNELEQIIKVILILHKEAEQISIEKKDTEKKKVNKKKETSKEKKEKKNQIIQKSIQ